MNFHKVEETGNIVLKPMGTLKNSSIDLKPAFYKCFDTGGIFSGPIPTFQEIKEKDGLINFSSGIVKEILDKVKAFFSEETSKAYKEIAITHKLGMLLYGPPGTGKTCTVALLMAQMVSKYDAICLDYTSKGIHFALYCAREIRRFQNNPIILFCDEVEDQIEDSAYLPFLDGNDSIDNSIFIGCTNFIDRVPDRIKNRRSRIKYLFEVKSLPLAVYREYIDKKIPGIQAEISAEFSYKAENECLTIDQYKNAIIDYYIDKVPIDEAIREAKQTL